VRIDEIELEADEVGSLGGKSFLVKFSPKLTDGTGFFTYFELFLTGGVVTWVDTVWFDGEAFFVGALRLVGEGRAMGTPGLPTFFEDADWDTGIGAKLAPGTAFVLLDLFLLPIPPCNIRSAKACRLYNSFSVNRGSSWSSNSLFNMGSVYL
jgi:hypothetical protein